MALTLFISSSNEAVRIIETVDSGSLISIHPYQTVGTEQINNDADPLIAIFTTNSGRTSRFERRLSEIKTTPDYTPGSVSSFSATVASIQSGKKDVTVDGFTLITGVGQIAAGALVLIICNLGPAPALIEGVTLAANASITFQADSPNRLKELDYDATGTTLEYFSLT